MSHYLLGCILFVLNSKSVLVFRRWYLSTRALKFTFCVCRAADADEAERVRREEIQQVIWCMFWCESRSCIRDLHCKRCTCRRSILLALYARGSCTACIELVLFLAIMSVSSLAGPHLISANLRVSPSRRSPIARSAMVWVAKPATPIAISLQEQKHPTHLPALSKR